MPSQPLMRPCSERVGARRDSDEAARAARAILRPEEKLVLVCHWLAVGMIVTATVIATGNGQAATTPAASAEAAPAKGAERAPLALGLLTLASALALVLARRRQARGHPEEPPPRSEQRDAHTFECEERLADELRRLVG